MREAIYYDKIQRLRLFDDVFMSEAFKDVACVELMLKVILGRDDVHVLSVKTQKILQGWGRTLRLDVWGIEERGQFNTEIQRTNDGADRKRARLHSSTLDYFSLEAGQKFRDLPDSYVIFITEHDFLKGNKPLYTIERCIMETGEKFNDGSHIVYVNASYQDLSTELGKLMHDFHCIKPEDMIFPEIAEKAAAEAAELNNPVVNEEPTVVNDPVVVEEQTVTEEPAAENDDELDLIVETEDDSEEPEEAVSFAKPKVVKAKGLLEGKTVIGTVEEPAETTTAAAVTTSLQEIIAKRATVVAAPVTVPAVKQETVPAPVVPKPFVHVNPFANNVSVAAPAAKATTDEEDGWVINDPIEFDEEIERDLGRNPDGSKKTWGTWVLEQQAEEIGDFDCLNLETDEDGMIIMPDQPVDQWLIHGATGTKDKKKNFRDSFLNNDVYDDIKLENSYNFGSEDCTNYNVIMDEIYG